MRSLEIHLKRPRREQKELKRIYICKSNPEKLPALMKDMNPQDTKGTFHTKKVKYLEIHFFREIRNSKDTEKNLKAATEIDQSHYNDNHTDLTH